MSSAPRIVLVGGPRCGKSSYARELRGQNIPTLCTDPVSKVKDFEEDVTYLPDGLDFEAAAEWISREWMQWPGPWCLDGVQTARALRYLVRGRSLPALAGLRVVLFAHQIEDAVTLPGQRAMHKAVMTVWNEIEWAFPQHEERRAA